MRKYLILLLPFLLTSCVQLRWVTIEKGHIVDVNGKPVKVVGNPQMVCFNTKHEVIAEGIFVYQKDNGAFVIDEYGKDYKVVENPHCRLGTR